MHITVYRRLCSSNTVYALLFRHRRTPPPYPVRKKAKQPYLSSLFLANVCSSLLFHGTRHRATFFPQHCHRLSRDSLDSFASTVFFLPPVFFFSLFVPVSFSVFLYSTRFSPPPAAAHHVLQYRRAASGVTPVIRDGPDEAFIILSEGSLSIRQHTVIIQSNG